MHLVVLFNTKPQLFTLCESVQDNIGENGVRSSLCYGQLVINHAKGGMLTMPL